MLSDEIKPVLPILGRYVAHLRSYILSNAVAGLAIAIATRAAPRTTTPIARAAFAIEGVTAAVVEARILHEQRIDAFDETDFIFLFVSLSLMSVSL